MIHTHTHTHTHVCSGGGRDEKGPLPAFPDRGGDKVCSMGYLFYYVLCSVLFCSVFFSFLSSFLQTLYYYYPGRQGRVRAHWGRLCVAARLCGSVGQPAMWDVLYIHVHVLYMYSTYSVLRNVGIVRYGYSCWDTGIGYSIWCHVMSQDGHGAGWGNSAWQLDHSLTTA
ncbi:hypothetical protein I7I48_10188 [Histoplasma ohiense]|nr:hypothetical protein I7I48_10188 [Histoplasma ohiense (nom. inval.)]